MATFKAARAKQVRRFKRVAFHRFEEARFLLDHGGYSTAAVYLGGYAVECALKALIFASDRSNTDPADTETEFIKNGKKAHSFDYLISLLITRRQRIPAEVRKQIGDINWWQTDLRCNPVRWNAAEADDFLATVEGVVRWIDERL